MCNAVDPYCSVDLKLEDAMQWDGKESSQSLTIDA